ncbi:4-aminobutyrate transaminase [Helicobacter sp. 13S00401-1]|uniref:4-aminobutyrate--2-oxoglutarate transaminase n=1 Tax=Helicobacter sp. 13S00401-1 TaxID=1905758 RepID=UPI000BA50CDF|nr:4-aminobutyrate--2-oxoglutarate transaminase [Helicobacter sp. 13S00401-1]PAF50399.1 4-aminobutyrate transaminase [Helicobacter sp. 13S00401-1]
MEKLTERRLKATPKGIGILCDWYAKEAKNATITSTDGREFIDFAGGIAVLNTGHCHPKVLKAVKDQLDKFTHTAYQITPYENYITLAEKINEIVPLVNPKTCFFCTGAEAVENAVKIARAYTKRDAVISFGGAFHGRTFMTMGLTGKVSPYKGQFGTPNFPVYHALYPNFSDDIGIESALKSIERLFKTTVSPNDVAAIIYEPEQGEGGFNVANNEFVVALRRLCDKHGILLIADEVQSGFGRTGKMFASEYFDVKPDIITMAKSIAGGFVLSGVSARAEVVDVVEKGGLGGTYAGNPVSIAAALAVLEVFKEEKLLDRSNYLGDRLKTFLNELIAKEDISANVRGLGSMVALEFGKAGFPTLEVASKVQKLAMESGLLLLTCGVYGNVIRFLYPLTIEEATFDKGLEILKQSILKAIK